MLEMRGAQVAQAATRPSAGYLPGLDGIRAISVAAVLLYHADLPWMPGGFLGVEVFFVISGYLITLILTEEHSRSSTISLRNFWTRRARRLLPALYTLLAVVSVIVLLFYREEAANLAAQVWSALFYVTNWYFIISEQSYFALVERPPVFQHLWSLAIEEQFYLVWPLALLGLLKLFGNRRRAMALVIFGGAALSLIWMSILFEPGMDPSRAYYGTDTRASGLLMGAALALLWRPSQSWKVDPQLKQRGLDLLGVGALVVIAVVFLRMQEFDRFLYNGGFAVVSISTLLVIMTAVHPGTLLNRFVLAQPILVWIGVRSYSLYLWHWPIFVFTRPGIDQPLGLYPTLILRLALTVIAADLSYRFIEVPIRNGAFRRWRQRLALREGTRRWAGPVALASVSGLLLVAVSTVDAGESRSAQQLVSQEVVPPPADDVATTAVPDPPVIPAGDATTLVPTTSAASTGDTTALASTVPTTAAPPTTVLAGPPPAPPGSMITVLGDSVLLGAEEQLTAELVASGYGVDYRATPAWMLDDANDEIAADGRPVGPVVVLGVGHNTLWERDRTDYDRWAARFDRQADELLATLRSLGAQRFVWITLREPDRSVIPEMGQKQFDQYIWYFPYVNERLDLLIQRNPDVVLADWAAVSNQPGLTYDAMHLTGEGTRLMIDTIRGAGNI